MEFLHHWGVEVIHQVQVVLADHKELMLMMSHAGDPRNAFLIYFPLVYCMNIQHGRRLMLAGVVSEWLNIVFKWILFGHRPYWWVHLNGSELVETIEQYPVTCETGPGSPSGHAMVTAAVYYIIADACSSKVPTWIPFSIFCILMVPINIARLFTATHFPHQVVAGTVCGIVISKLLDKYANLSKWELADYLRVSTLLFFGCIGFSWSLGQLGVDLHWSLPLAYKWCAKPTWISLNTTPYNSVVRDSCVLAGYGVSQTLSKNLRRPIAVSKLELILHCTISLATVNLIEKIEYSFDSAMLFYALSALKHMTIPFVVVYLVPFLLSKCFTWKLNKAD